MIKIILIATAISLAVGYDFPMYKQCDPKWAHEQLGTSSNTICSAGCLMSSAAMALYGIGNTQFNPSTLNKWLTANGGYESGDLFVWESINKFGMTFIGKVTRDKIIPYLDSGYLAFPNVHNGRHWVLAFGHDGGNILVHDPNYTTPSYTLDQIVEGNTGIYAINRAPSTDSSWFSKFKLLANSAVALISMEDAKDSSNIRKE